MRQYEVMVVLMPTMADDEVQQTLEVFKAAAQEKGAQILNVEEWGRRRLAYPIRRHKEGIFTLLTLEESAALAVSELERRFRVSDAVIRFLSVRVDQELKRLEKFKARREQKVKKRPPRPTKEKQAETTES